MPAELYTASAMINSQLVPQTRSVNYYPTAVGPVVQSVPASPPQSPPGYGSNSLDSGANASKNPWSFTDSPVPWLIVAFLGGYLLLRFVHHGY